jgi:putative hydrolase of the HAD superfamily
VSKIQAVIFDFYGTLADIETDEGKREIYECLSRYLQYYGADISTENLRFTLDAEKERYFNTIHERYPELDFEVVFSNVLKKEGLNNPFLVESCCKLFRLLSRKRLDPFSDSLPVLSEMKRKGYPLAIISNAQKVFSLDEIRMTGLDRFFNHVLLSTQFGFAKPDPRLFSIACDLLGTTPANTVYIGDNAEKDIMGPKEIGMQMILLERNQKEANLKMKPDYRASELWQAWEWIKSTE